MIIKGFEIGRQEISIAFMILFAMVAMFFLGYKLAYDNAINYANEQIEDITSEHIAQYELINPNLGRMLENNILEDTKLGEALI